VVEIAFKIGVIFIFSPLFLSEALLLYTVFNISEDFIKILLKV